MRRSSRRATAACCGESDRFVDSFEEGADGERVVHGVEGAVDECIVEGAEGKRRSRQRGRRESSNDHRGRACRRSIRRGCCRARHHAHVAFAACCGQ